MRVLHISYSAQGGAGVAAAQIVKAQQSVGLNAELQFASELNVTNSPFSHPLATSTALVDKFVLARPTSSLFSSLRANVQTLPKFKPREFDVLNLHWTPGAVSLKRIVSLVESGVKVVWTMHDMFPFSGGCHYSQGCSGFTGGCHNCPQLRTRFSPRTEAQIRDKARIFQLGTIAVAPSLGLKSLFDKSFVGQQVDSVFIPNPIRDMPAAAPSSSMPGAQLLFAAADVNDPRKGLERVLDWWQVRGDTIARLVLAGRGSERHTDAKRRILGLGELTQEQLMQEISNSRAVVVASSEDNAPNVVAEAHMCGVPIFVPAGLPIAGWLRSDGAVLVDDSEIREVLKSGASRAYQASMLEFVQNRSSTKVGQQYANLYASVLGLQC